MSEAKKNTETKKNVLLSGISAGHTAICTVGREGRGLHYRGYDIHDLARGAEFAEIAYLLLHGHLPTRRDVDAFRRRIIESRGLPEPLTKALELLPASADPMDVLRTGC